MNFFNKKENGYIILKDGYNKSFIVGFIVVIVLLIALVSTKIFLPDGRNKMTLNDKNEMSFKDTIITLDDGYYWNEKTGVAQFTFKESCIDENEEKVNVTVTTDENVEMPLNLIKGVATPEEDGSMVMITNYICQFGLPKDTYYLKFKMIKGDISYDFIIDYRDFEKKEIKEFEENYLVDKYNLENEVQKLNEQKETLKLELSEIEKLTVEEKQLKQPRIDEINKQIMKLENDIKVDQHKLEVLEQGKIE